MTNQGRAYRAVLDPASPGSSPAAGRVRSPTADALQFWIDGAAHFNMFSMPDPAVASPAIFASGDSENIIGFNIHEVLHRFGVVMETCKAQTSVRARNTIRERAGKSKHRWLLAPDDFVGSPGHEPPPTTLNPTRPQRFIMLDSVCTFGDGSAGFRGFGTGRTLPVTIDGQPQLLATAVGTIVQGSGKLKGHEEGTYVYCGTISAQRGFTGNMLLRVMDSQHDLSTDNALQVFGFTPNPQPEIIYFLFRGQAAPLDRVAPWVAPSGRQTGLIVEQGLRQLDLDFTSVGPGSLRSTAEVGPSIGRITAYVTFDVTAPGGSIIDPIPFTSYDEFVFQDHEGKRIGTLVANSNEGRVFHTQVAGLPGIRFGGTGQILKGTGIFEGISGLMTDNSVVVFSPHVSASVYVLRIHDPQGKFGSTIKG
jgi:hypothetical protein